MSADYVKPTTCIARILRGLGLKQGTDFRVRGEYESRGGIRERVGTYIVTYSNEADQVVADNADLIEELSAFRSNSFRVSVYYTSSGRRWTWVANYGDRTRETAPVAAAEPDGAVLDTASKKVAHTTGHRIVGGPATIATPQRGAGAHPYDGLAQKRFGVFTWACEEAGQSWFFQNTANDPQYRLEAYRGRADVHGWYLSGPGIETTYVGPTLTVAATVAEGAILGYRR